MPAAHFSFAAFVVQKFSRNLNTMKLYTESGRICCGSGKWRDLGLGEKRNGAHFEFYILKVLEGRSLYSPTLRFIM